MKNTVTILESDLDLVCAVLAGLQAPVSLNPTMIGAAYKPWQDLHHSAAFGWKDPDDYKESILKRAEAN
jgi:hypothetical protein